MSSICLLVHKKKTVVVVAITTTLAITRISIAYDSMENDNTVIPDHEQLTLNMTFTYVSKTLSNTVGMGVYGGKDIYNTIQYILCVCVLVFVLLLMGLVA